MADDEVRELVANLDEYREQLQQLEELILDEPENQDYQGLYSDVQEAIELTEAALASHRGEAAAASVPSTSAPSDPSASVRPGAKRKSRFDTGEALSLPSLPISGSALPKKVLDQIRVAKARSALEGHAPAGWAIGYGCLARTDTGQWAPATVLAVLADGSFKVKWTANLGEEGGVAVVHTTDCRPQDTADYKGVKAPIRKAVEEVNKDTFEKFLKGEQAGSAPKWMEILDTDSAKEREKKIKAVKAWKKKQRFEKKDLQSTKQAKDWKSFISGKGSKKKTGFMTSGKKESMFSVPPNSQGKVGVIGSGRGMTDTVSKRTRVDF